MTNPAASASASASEIASDDLEALKRLRRSAEQARKAYWDGATAESRSEAASRLAVILSELQHPRLAAAAAAVLG